MYESDEEIRSRERQADWEERRKQTLAIIAGQIFAAGYRHAGVRDGGFVISIEDSLEKAQKLMDKVDGE